MVYRTAGAQDWPGITVLVGMTGVYMPIDAAVLADGGHWIVAEDDDGLAGCAWVLASGKHAYVDYVSVRPDLEGSGLGPRLCVRVVSAMKKSGVKYVRALTVNPVMVKIIESLGGYTDSGYHALSLYLGE